MNTAENFYLEHANITVKNIDESVKFFQTAFPEMKIRGGGEGNNGPWIHIGTDVTYFALNEDYNQHESVKNYSSTGINHIGFVVQNVDQVAERLLGAGYERSYPKQIQQFRIRDYFLDKDGNEYEFVQYHSDEMSERNDYTE